MRKAPPLVSTPALQRYVLLPARGMASEALAPLAQGPDPALSRAFSARRKNEGAAPAAGAAGAPRPKPRRLALRILHSLGVEGPKLAEMGADEALALRAAHPGIKAVPVVYYHPARAHRLQVRARPAALSASHAATPGLVLVLKVVDAASQQPLAGAQVVAFTDFEKGEGAQGRSNAKGEVRLRLGGTRKKLDLLAIYPPAGHWGLARRRMVVRSGQTLGLEAIDFRQPDYLALCHGKTAAGAGAGVTVGVIDTGVDPAHPALKVDGGAVFVAGEQDAGDWGPAARDGEHGTHVAGIVAASGRAPDGRRGVAPGVRLRAYRVFPNEGDGASNYDILRAIERGVEDGCDLLNLSLGGDEPDEAVREAIKDAFDQGTVCIVAAGNDGRGPVSYPARWPEAVAVSAAGRIGSFPEHSTESLDIAGPRARSDDQVFIAAFSNVGPEIDLTGPGVGIVSTLPGGAWGVMSGTSMACPAVTGALAARLSAHPQVLALPRGRERSIEILKLMNQAARPLGFPKELEGLGLIR